MDQTTFARELDKLAAIGVAQAAQARAAAWSLTDTDREAFFKKLVAIGAELEEAQRRELKALEAFEVSLIDLEKRLKRSMRTSAETKDRRTEAQKAEAKLKKFS
ncbi:MAG: hypothetical protein PHX87_01575 [Candidatus Peribacteraceae bacterium]|nr:hypothetical protein [Candidatus Peribacteraceae bacterium]MDD5742097.1 hypothetical protein [Candidatus Peribacteraceae bacterium]